MISSPLTQEVQHLFVTNFVGLSCLVSVVYDHILTFSDEVEYIWNAPMKPIVYAFYFNRYFFPLAFAVQIFSYFSPLFTIEVCNRYVRYEGACHLISIGLSGYVLIKRVDAIYGKDKRISSFLWLLWLVQIVSLAYFLTGAESVPRSPNVTAGCSMIFSANLGKLDALPVAANLVFDTVVLSLTWLRTKNAMQPIMKQLLRGNHDASLREALLEDGLLYYVVLTVVNLLYTIMVATDPPGIRNVVGQVAFMLTVTMISRITLNVRKAGHKNQNVRLYDAQSRSLAFKTCTTPNFASRRDDSMSIPLSVLSTSRRNAQDSIFEGNDFLSTFATIPRNGENNHVLEEALV